MTEPAGMRTHRNGELRADHVGHEVALCGWVARRRDHGGVAFIDLRDASGVVQVVIHDEAVAHPLRSEFCLRIVGTVRRRPEGNDNPNLATGAVEVPPDPETPASMSPEVPLVTAVGAAAADVLARAVLVGVLAAESVAGIPTYRDMLPGAFAGKE